MVNKDKESIEKSRMENKTQNKFDLLFITGYLYITKIHHNYITLNNN